MNGVNNMFSILPENNISFPVDPAQLRKLIISYDNTIIKHQSKMRGFVSKTECDKTMFNLMTSFLKLLNVLRSMYVDQLDEIEKKLMVIMND